MPFKVLPHAQWPENVQVVNCRENQRENACGEETPVMLWVMAGAGDKNKEMNVGQTRP